MKATNIQWDCDTLEEFNNLPKEMDIPLELFDLDDISDWITDKTGYCHFGFSLSEDINIDKIKEVCFKLIKGNDANPDADDIDKNPYACGVHDGILDVLEALGIEVDEQEM